MNPVIHASGLHQNITEYDNALDLDLAREVASRFRISTVVAEEIIDDVIRSVREWSNVAKKVGLSRSEITSMESAFTAH